MAKKYIMGILVEETHGLDERLFHSKAPGLAVPSVNQDESNVFIDPVDTHADSSISTPDPDKVSLDATPVVEPSKAKRRGKKPQIAINDQITDSVTQTVTNQAKESAD